MSAAEDLLRDLAKKLHPLNGKTAMNLQEEIEALQSEAVKAHQEGVSKTLAQVRLTARINPWRYKGRLSGAQRFYIFTEAWEREVEREAEEQHALIAVEAAEEEL
jgi:hypothetical protein